MEKLGSFDHNVVAAFNDFAEDYALSPGKNGESSYSVGYIALYDHLSNEYWVEEWVPLTYVTYHPWGTLFLQKWDAIKNQVIFNGGVCSLTRMNKFTTGEKSVYLEDRITRKVGTLTVLDLLDLAQPILFEANLGHFRGGIQDIYVKDQTPPTIEFNL